MKQNITVTATPATDETFARALGIAAEREQQIDELMDKYHSITNTYPDAIAALSAELDNANELAYAAFHLGAFAESQRSKHELLQKLMEA